MATKVGVLRGFARRAWVVLSLNTMSSSPVVELERTVRFCLRADGTLDAAAPVDNSHAAWPPMHGFGRYYELHVVCAGPIDPVTGYFLNIKRLDRAVRERGLPVIAAAAERNETAIGPVLRELWRVIDEPLEKTVRRVTLHLTPTFAVILEARTMNGLLLSQRYEFAAAHRLHADELDEAENRRVFGKCNNPSGHGHNYQVEVTVRTAGDRPVGSAELDGLVDRAIVERFDHKHLNVDTPEFRGVNPSVEQIAKVCFDLLAGEVKSIDAELVEVKVWETEKTVCTYRG